MVVQESTLKRSIFPAVIDLVQLVRVVSCALVAVDIVGGVADVMLSASVGGKLA